MIRTIQLFSSIVFFAIVGCSNNDVSDKSASVKSDTTSTRVKSDDKKTILFFGNSLTAGYGVEADESFPALIQMRIDSLNLPYTVVNAGVSGETTATGLSRIDWVLEKQEVNIFVLELGANDGLRGLPPVETKKNLITMIDRVRKAHPTAKIILAGMMVPPSMGVEYSSKYNPIYGEIAKEKIVELIPFLLEDVGGVESLNQSDGIHPNPAGAKIVAENVWDILEAMVRGS